MASFTIGKHVEFLNTANVPYGCIEIDGLNLMYVTTVQEGKMFLQRGVKDGKINPDEAMAIENQLVAANLPTDSTALYATLAAFELPTGYVPNIEFQICNCTDLQKHGYVVSSADHTKRASFSVFDLFDGFMQCEINVRVDVIDPLNAISVFQDMVKAGLPEKMAESQYDMILVAISTSLFGS